jgi:hypothetical protein
MRLRKLFAAALATLAFAGVLTAPAFAGKPFTDGDGSCADYVEGSVTYNADGTLSGDAQLAARACNSLTYSLNIYPAGTVGAPGGTVPIARVPATSVTNVDTDGDGVADAGNLHWDTSVAGVPSAVCVTLTSDQNRKTSLDVVPDFVSPECGAGPYIAAGGSGAGSWH